jgi:hypothetical protein
MLKTLVFLKCYVVLLAVAYLCCIPSWEPPITVRKIQVVHHLVNNSTKDLIVITAKDSLTFLIAISLSKEYAIYDKRGTSKSDHELLIDDDSWLIDKLSDTLFIRLSSDVANIKWDTISIYYDTIKHKLPLYLPIDKSTIDQTIYKDTIIIVDSLLINCLGL